MSRWFWILLAVAISTSVYFTIRYGLRPKPIPVLDPTSFQSPDQIGAVVYRSLRPMIRGERLIVIGSDTRLPAYKNMWGGFLATALADGVKVDVMFLNETLEAPNLPGAVAAWQKISYKADDLKGLLAEVQSRLQRGHMVVVAGVSGRTTHLVKDSLSRKLERVAHHPVMSISNLPFAIDTGEQDDLSTQCLNPAAEDGVAHLECAALRVSQKFAKKHLDPQKLWAVVEQHGLKEFLVFIHHGKTVTQP